MTNATPRVFLDSNILFSAFYGSANCEKIIKAHQERKIIAVVSQQVVEESTKNTRAKIPEALTYFESLLTSNPPELISDPIVLSSKTKSLISPKDQPIFTSAHLAKVDYFVTGNIKDFKVKELKNITDIKVLTPKQLVEALGLK